MKKILLSLSITAIMLHGSLIHAQTPAQQPTTAPTPPATTTAAATDKQKMQNLAGAIYSCTTTQPLIGWKFITVSLDQVGSGQLNVSGYATMNNNTVKKIRLCDKDQTAQNLIDMLLITGKGKNIEWQSLWFRTKPDRQFEFAPLTSADINQMIKSTSTAAAQPK